MEKIKALFKNKKVLAGTIVLLLLAIVGTVFVLNQPQTKNEVTQQETISDAEHEKLVAKMKELQEADKIAKAKAEEDKKIAEEKAKAKEEAEKKAAEEKQKEVKEKEDAEKKTHPVQPQPEKKVQTAEKPVVDTGATKKEDTKPVEKPKPVERKRLGELGNSGLEFKTYDELLAYVNTVFTDNPKDSEEWNKKMGFEIFGWSGWTVDYSDGSQTWTIQWKP